LQSVVDFLEVFLEVGGGGGELVLKLLEDFGSDSLGWNESKDRDVHLVGTFGRGDVFKHIWMDLAHLLEELFADGKTLFGAFFFLLHLFSLSRIFI